MWLKITKKYSPNFTLPKRHKEKIKFIIIHYTGMKRESLAIKKLCNHKSKVSAHYFLKKNGEILNLVPDLYEAWHAGKSNWKKFKSINQYSIGIEIQNTGHDHIYENFSLKQIYSLKKLLRFLKKTHNINPKNILGHSDISPDRKKDPGEKFPWKTFFKIKLAHGHNLDQKKLEKLRLISLTSKEKKLFFSNLYKIGYNKIKNNNLNSNHLFLVKAFQRRFRQDLINGKIDKECLLISKKLV